MFPIYDENRSGIRPYLTWLLIASNVIVFIWELSLGFGYDGRATVSMLFNYGSTPARILSGRSLETLITSMFMHGDIFHLGSNVLFLYVFGDNIEARFGRLRYLAAYLLFGVAASYAHAYYSLFLVGSVPAQCTLPIQNPLCVPAIGASGAISGVLGAYMVLYPRARIATVILILRFFPYLVKIPAIFYLGLWFFLQQVVLGLLSPFAGVAFWAHIGGFAVGAIAGLIARFAGRERSRHSP